MAKVNELEEVIRINKENFKVFQEMVNSKKAEKKPDNSELMAAQHKLYSSIEGNDIQEISNLIEEFGIKKLESISRKRSPFGYYAAQLKRYEILDLLASKGADLHTNQMKSNGIAYIALTEGDERLFQFCEDHQIGGDDDFSKTNKLKAAEYYELYGKELSEKEKNDIALALTGLFSNNKKFFKFIIENKLDKINPQMIEGFRLNVDGVVSRTFEHSDLSLYNKLENWLVRGDKNQFVKKAIDKFFYTGISQEQINNYFDYCKNKNYTLNQTLQIKSEENAKHLLSPLWGDYLKTLLKNNFIKDHFLQFFIDNPKCLSDIRDKMTFLSTFSQDELLQNSSNGKSIIDNLVSGDDFLLREIVNQNNSQFLKKFVQFFNSPQGDKNLKNLIVINPELEIKIEKVLIKKEISGAHRGKKRKPIKVL